MMAQLDFVSGSDGLINYSEFLAATIDLKSIVSEDKLKAVFKMFDTDNSDYITVENMQIAFQKQGNQISLQEIKAYISQYDVSSDGRIDF
jgi:calcium-dependent protein kinase